MLGRNAIPPFSQHMGRRKFITAVVRRVQTSVPQGAERAHWIYSIRVVQPKVFHISPNAQSNLNLGSSPITQGSIYSDELYQLAPDRLGEVLRAVIESGARTFEVKVSDEPEGPWEIIRVNLPH